jgi:hypothetical protein
MPPTLLGKSQRVRPIMFSEFLQHDLALLVLE